MCVSPAYHSNLTSGRKRTSLVKINMADTEKKRDAPVLIAVDDVSVTQWVKSYEAYVKRGGTRPGSGVLVGLNGCVVCVGLRHISQLLCGQYL